MDSENNIFSKVGGRKFVLAILILLLSVAVTLYKGQLDGSLAALMIGILGAFGAANVAGKRLSSEVSSKEQLPIVEPIVAPDTSALESKVADLETSIAQLSDTQQKIVALISGSRK